MSAFADALEANDLAGVRGAPKADLHVHGVCGGDRAFLHERTGVDIAPLERGLASMDEMHAFIEANLGPVLRAPGGRALAFEATFLQARKDGVTRIEVGEDVWGVTLHDGSAVAVWRMLCAARDAGAPDIEWIPQIQPHARRRQGAHDLRRIRRG
jgi:hypothetical protein